MCICDFNDKHVYYGQDQLLIDAELQILPNRTNQPTKKKKKKKKKKNLKKKN